MKKIIISGLLLNSISLFANCPTLSGNYTCKDMSSDSEGPEELLVSQATAANGITTYTIETEGNSSDLIADGVERLLTWGSDEPTTAKITCENNQLKIDLTEIAQSFPGAQSHLYFKTSAEGMDVEMKFLIPGQGSGTEQVSKCTKK